MIGWLPISFVLTVSNSAFCLLSKGRSLKRSVRLKINTTLWVPIPVTVAGATLKTQATCPGKSLRKCGCTQTASGVFSCESTPQLCRPPAETLAKWDWFMSLIMGEMSLFSEDRKVVQLALELLRACAFGEADLYRGPWLYFGGFRWWLFPLCEGNWPREGWRRLCLLLSCPLNSWGNC